MKALTKIKAALLGKSPSGLDNIDSLDGLRGIAVLFVLLSHLSNIRMDLLPFLSFSGIGKVGVWLFFSLSAFLLTLNYISKPDANLLSYRLWRNYAIRRVFRVFPLYIFVLTVSWLFPIDGYFTHLSNADYIKHLTLQDGKDVFWSIPVEVKYYFVLPFVVILIRYVLKYRPLLVAASTVAVVVIWLAFPPHYNPVALAPYLPIFILGSFAAFCHFQLNTHAARVPPYLAAVFELAAIAILALVLLLTPAVWSAIVGYQVPMDYFHQDFVLFGVLWAAFIVFYLHGKEYVKRILAWDYLRIVGVISFGAYLWHMPVVRFVQEQIPLHSTVQAVLGLALTFLVSIVTYFLIERPCSQFSARITKTPAKTTLAGVAPQTGSQEPGV